MNPPLVALAAAAALWPLAASPQGYRPAPALRAQEPQRSAWYIGFGVGTGTGASYWADGSTTSASGFQQLGFDFKVGATLSPEVLFGFDLRYLRGLGAAEDGDAWSAIANYDAMLTFFPWGRGLYFEGGGGLSSLSGRNGGTGSDYGVAGLNGTLGLGYAFWLGSRLHLTLSADYSRQWYGLNSTGPAGSGFVLGYLGFEWY